MAVLLHGIHAGMIVVGVIADPPRRAPVLVAAALASVTFCLTLPVRSNR